MYDMMYNGGFQGFGWFPGGTPTFLLLMVWSLFWKGLALWHSSRRSQPWWFVILLVLNTAGILEIVYLFLVAKVKTDALFALKK